MYVCMETNTSGISTGQFDVLFEQVSLWGITVCRMCVWVCDAKNETSLCDKKVWMN